MQQDAALQQREACLPIRTAFDPFHFIDEALHHAVAPGLGAAIDHRLGIVGQSVHKTDQLGNPTGLDSGFPLLQTPLPLALSQQAAKVLCEPEHDCDGLVTLDELIQIGRFALLYGFVLASPS